MHRLASHPAVTPRPTPAPSLARRLVGAAAAFARACASPTIARFHDLETALLPLSTPEAIAAMGARFRAAPDLAPAFAERFLSPPHRLEQVADLPAGTFGHAFYRFMADHRLDPEYLPPREQESDLGWFRARMGQAHDQWHALLGIDPDVAGEVEIIAFLLAQFRRSLPREPLAPTFSAAMAAAYLVHTLATRPLDLPRCLRALGRGLRRGQATPPLWAVRWEALWPLPLAEVRATLGVTA